MIRHRLLLFLVLATGLAFGADSSLKVLTYNIHHGEGVDGKLDIDRIGKIIRDSAAGLVAIQEVDSRSERVHGADQLEQLRKATGSEGVFGKAMDFQGGGYGQVILSRWPILEHAVHQLPQRAGREPRILVLAKIKHPHGPLWFGSVHLDHQLDEVRIDQVKRMVELLTKLEGPFIVAGDFNARPESEPIRLMLSIAQDAAAANPLPTIPVDKPTARIDYIFLKQGAGAARESSVLDERVASDHRPFLAEFFLK